jgi:cell division protein FtsL
MKPGRRALGAACALAAVLSVPAVIWLGVARGRRYAELRQEVLAMEAEQREWVERNKRLIADISALESPARLEGLADSELGLKRAGSEDILHVEIGNAGR